MATVLVVDDDADIARFIEINLRLEGFTVRLAHDGEAAEQAISDEPPDLVLLDVMMPKLDGVELCRRLRANPATAHLPVIMLTAKSMSADKVVGLTAGADDYIIKPFETVELIARVRSTLRRTADMRSVSPLTGLPGNNVIERHIADRVAAGKPFAVCYLDLDNFKAFNDCYGFLRGDEVLTLLATVARHAVLAAGEPAPFLGHVGGDDFVLVCHPEQAESIAQQIVEEFDADAPLYYDDADREHGYVELTGRNGAVQRFPLVSVSIGVAPSTNHAYRDHREVVATATEMKRVAKRASGSAVAIDRRTAG